ncbi:M20 family metallo-hydrolase [Luteolibacter pohnpeiensis]|uniref:M20 family metallo-hydrolase n=1 Tax=Luteolibacter pohnpeiensis TaxID=454153 RepID=A0A934S2S6_9BACT|nr:M20 family metallo-hydrolase [Luteolibacter pohnpeiensis]MBK1881282.1 M20 family metallo-hydrolase [Luteolibacter pohnpeiensis]
MIADCIEMDRLSSEIEELGNISEYPLPAVTRVLFSDADLRARAWFKERCLSADLSLHEDAIGNLFATWLGQDPDLEPVATGSHLDAIPNAGKYDGVVGVLGGLEAIRALKASGYVPRRSIVLIMFTAEEPTRFGVGCLGSRMMSGVMPLARAELLQDENGLGLNHWRGRAGHVSEMSDVLLDRGAFSSFVELHIEQGPKLEERGIDIGVVEKIAAPAAFRFHLTGAGGHAGAVLMPDRHDALLAGAEIALAVEKAAITSGSADTVATTGVFEVKPGAINSIPFAVKMEVDLRDTDMAARERAEKMILTQSADICTRRGIECSLETINSDEPAVCDANLVSLVEAKSLELGFSTQRMISRAYHDSLFMARLSPITMIFIPCFKGYSHRPDEYSSPEAIRKGVAVLAETLKSLSL